MQGKFLMNSSLTPEKSAIEGHPPQCVPTWKKIKKWPTIIIRALRSALGLVKLQNSPRKETGHLSQIKRATVLYGFPFHQFFWWSFSPSFQPLSWVMMTINLADTVLMEHGCNIDATGNYLHQDFHHDLINWSLSSTSKACTVIGLIPQIQELSIVLFLTPVWDG